MPAQPGDLPIDSALVGGTELANRLNRILPDIATNTTTISNHLSTPNPHPQYMLSANNNAGATAFAPSGNIAANNVQLAIQELDNEKVSKYGDTMLGTLNGLVSQWAGDMTFSVNGAQASYALNFTSPGYPGAARIYGKHIPGTFLGLQIDTGGLSGFTFGGTGFTSPGNVFSLAAQSTAANALTRKDYVDSVAGGGNLGVSQNWQAVSRAFGTLYYNTTGKPIEVLAYAWRTSSSTSNMNIVVNGVAIPFVRGSNSGGGNYASGSIIIPKDASYYFVQPTDALTGAEFYELR